MYGLSADPINNNVFVSACDDGRILLYDIRAPPADGMHFDICLCKDKSHGKTTIKSFIDGIAKQNNKCFDFVLSNQA